MFFNRLYIYKILILFNKSLIDILAHIFKGIVFLRQYNRITAPRIGYKIQLTAISNDDIIKEIKNNLKGCQRNVVNNILNMNVLMIPIRKFIY